MASNPSIIPSIESTAPAGAGRPRTSSDPADTAGSLWAGLGRRALLRALGGLEHGELQLIDGARTWRFGARTPRCDLSATLRVLDPRFYARTAFGGSVGAGDAYIRGYWSCEDLTALVRIMVVNRVALTQMERGLARLSQPLRRAFHWLRRNTPSGSARNIAAHYDLGNELYRLMLDETMAYSCAIFPSDGSTLAEGSRAKFDAACRKLALGPEDHLLEIGTGWGGLALHAARERIAAAGLADRVTLLLEDYRELKGNYDKLVSIEMIEAVGARYLPAFFRRCSNLLAPHGAMLLQAITIQDQLYADALDRVDYIQHYIFPGSFIPSVTALLQAICEASDLKLFHMEDIGPHYARTLALWRRNFFDHVEQVRQLGYPDSFVRLWEFYLCYCEGGFAERQLGDVQMLLTKPACRRAPITTVAPIATI